MAIQLQRPRTAAAGCAPQVGVLPARYQSSRFPGKPLVPILGKPMILHTYEQVGAGPLSQRCSSPSRASARLC